jgi:hypothetical protein
MDVDQRRAVDAILRHDHESSGAEIVYYFVHELGVGEREAWQAVLCRRGLMACTAAAVPASEYVARVVTVLS